MKASGLDDEAAETVFRQMRRHRVEPSLAAGVLLLLLADT
jgi:hypothetical protein